MTPWPTLVPDSIQPLSAYRVWRYVLNRRTATLHSMTCGWLGDCPWSSAPTDWVYASCATGNDHPWHRTPDEGCSCGIYAVPTLDELLTHFDPGVIGAGTGQVMGRVELAGKIIEHDRGFRAERARLVELVPSEAAGPDLIRLAHRLGLPLAAPAPWPELSPLDAQILDMMIAGATRGDISASTGLTKSTVSRSLERTFRMLELRKPIPPGVRFWLFGPPDQAA